MNNEYNDNQIEMIRTKIIPKKENLNILCDKIVSIDPFSFTKAPFVIKTQVIQYSTFEFTILIFTKHSGLLVR